MAYVEGEGRKQGTLFPVVLDDLIPSDHMCRVIDAFVEQLNIEKLGFEPARRALNHVPIVDPHPRRNGISRSQLPKLAPPPKLAPELTPAELVRYRERTTVERVFSRLKDELGARYIRVRGAAKR